jgi:hypothetical protein
VTRSPANPEDWHGQVLHCDSAWTVPGEVRRPRSFGRLGPRHDVSLSVIVPLTDVAKLDHAPELTRAVQDGTWVDLGAKRRSALIETLAVRPCEQVLVFAHDFVHAGARDEPNARMFLCFKHPKTARTDTLGSRVVIAV